MDNNCPIQKVMITEEEIIRRLKICADCPDKKIVNGRDRCKFCGCSLHSVVKYSCFNTQNPKF